MKRIVFTFLFVFTSCGGVTFPIFAQAETTSVWVQTDWSGGPGQLLWTDTTTNCFWEEDGGVNYWKFPNELHLRFWRETGEFPHTVYMVPGFIQASDSALYVAVADGLGWVLRSANYGESWEETGTLEGCGRTTSIIQTMNGSLFVTGRIGHFPNYWATVFKSTDMGQTWEEIFRSSVLRSGGVGIVEGSDSTLFFAIRYYDLTGDIYMSSDRGETWVKTRKPPDVRDFGGLRRWLDEGIYVQGRVDTSGGDWAFSDIPPRLCGISLEIPYSSFYGSYYDYAALFRFDEEETTWVEVGKMPEAAYSLLQAQDSTIYAGIQIKADDVNYPGVVFKSTDWGVTWDTTGYFPGYPDKWNLPDALIESSDGTIYAGVDNNSGGTVFSSTDKGETWQEVGGGRHNEEFGQTVWSLLEADNRALYAGTAGGRIGCVLRGEYTEGSLFSSIYDTKDSPMFERIYWISDGDSVMIKVRTDSLPNMFGATSWEECAPCTNGQDISSLSSVHDGHRYIQYQVEMSTVDQRATPALSEMRIEYCTVGLAETSEAHNPSAFSLDRNHPNPFNPTTVIPYTIPPIVERSQPPTTLKVYNLLGQVVRTLIDGPQQPGEHRVIWDGRDDRGKEVSSGIYLCRLTVEGRGHKVRKVALIR